MGGRPEPPITRLGQKMRKALHLCGGDKQNWQPSPRSRAAHTWYVPRMGLPAMHIRGMYRASGYRRAAHTGYVPGMGLPAAKPCTYLWSKGPKPAFGGRYVQRNRPGVKVSCTYEVCAPLFAPSGLGADKTGHGWKVMVSGWGRERRGDTDVRFWCPGGGGNPGVTGPEGRRSRVKPGMRKPQARRGGSWDRGGSRVKPGMRGKGARDEGPRGIPGQARDEGKGSPE